MKPYPTLEPELRRILVRHLPMGLEGVGHAQARAVIRMLDRHDSHRGPGGVIGPTRDALRSLERLALRHHASAQTAGNLTTCGVCRTPDGASEPWPCPVWEVADQMGATKLPHDSVG